MPDYWDYDIDVADRIKWYEGETGIEDKPDGFGQAWFNDGSVYNGQWLYGAMEGHGIMEYPNGDIYEGEWKEGKCEDEEGFYLCLSDTPTRSLNMQLGDAYIGEFNDHLSKTCGEGKFVLLMELRIKDMLKMVCLTDTVFINIRDFPLKGIL